MSSPITHASIVVLAYFFPLSFNALALLIGSQLPDIECIFLFLKKLFVKKDLVKAYLYSDQGFLHTLLGSVLITIPLGTILTYFFSTGLSIGATLLVIFLSVSIGVISHLLLDLPGHRDFLLLYPFYKRKGNPFLFRPRLGFLEKFYPWRRKEDTKNQVMAEYSWFVFSHIFFILAVILLLIKSK